MKFLVAAIIAIVASGCAGRKFYIHPTVEVGVINDCPGSVLTVVALNGDKTIVPYGDMKHVVLEQGWGHDRRIVLTARGVNRGGLYMGSASRIFTTTQRGTDDKVWQIRSLTGGLGCERIRR
jgi:hypothetical protein